MWGKSRHRPGKLPRPVAMGTHGSNGGPILELLDGERLRGQVERELANGGPVGDAVMLGRFEELSA